MRRFSVVHVGVAAGLAAATVTGIGVIQQVSAAGGTSSVFVPTAPCRLADTRPAPDNVGVRNTPIGQGEAVTFQVSGANGQCSIPATATAIGGNLTAVGPTAGGFLTAYPTGGVRPLTSNLNFVAGNAPIGNSFTATLSSSGAFDLFNNAGRVDAIIDINGYYEPSTNGPAGPTGPAGPVSASCIALIRWDTCNRTTTAGDITVGRGPNGVAFDGTNIWVTNFFDTTMSKVNPSTNTVTPVFVGSDQRGVAFDGSFIWVAHGANTVRKINPVSNVFAGTVSVGSRPTGLAFDGTNIWVTNNGGNTVSKINPSTNAVSATVTVGNNPYGVAFDGTSIWVTNFNGNTVSKINPTTNNVTATVTGLNGPGGVAFDGTNIWVTNSGGNTVSKISPVTNTVTATVTGLNGPSGVAFDGTNIWVTNSGGNTVSKVNPVTNTVTATVTVSSFPQGVAFDGTNIWVAIDASTGTVSKIRV